MIPQVSALSRLPQELQQFKQWVVADTDKSPLVYSGNGLRRVSIYDTQSFHTFADACAIGQHYNASVGFILTETDPFCCIDLDVKDSLSMDKQGKPCAPQEWTTAEQLERYQSIINYFGTYSEISTSGKGVHLWLYGSIGKGVKRDGVEVYSQERFIICTGNAFSAVQFNQQNNVVTTVITDPTARPIIVPPEGLLYNMTSQMRSMSTPIDLVELDEELTDTEIVEKATRAANGDKFNALCHGNWQALGYPSQSEADFALMAILAFYTKSNEQVRRIFRYTNLGQRDKATKDNRYLDFNLKTIRGRQHNEEAAQQQNNLRIQEYIAAMQNRHIQQLEAVPAAIEHAELPPVPVAELTWPPGLAGAIAGFIYNSSQRPVKEVAIVSALGLLAGICGKAYCLDDTGLNVYITLIARSGIGKEAMHSGIVKLLNKITMQVPAASRFVTFTDFVSGPALMKHCAANPSSVCIAGEWGRKIKRMAVEDREGPMQQLRTVLTNLYQKSGPSSIAGGLTYSNKENDTDAIKGVNFSLIGESTPGTFFESLTGSMMEDGFMSRFTIVEYHGDRPDRNHNVLHVPDQYLVDALCGLCTQASTLIARVEYQPVKFTEEAKALDERFNRHCDEAIRQNHDESFRQMYNRAHLKALRIAGLLAVADNWINPVIHLNHMEWAIALIKRDILFVTRRLSEGDVGTDDGTRDKKLLQLIREYVGTRLGHSYGINPQMQKDGVIPKRYLQIRAGRLTCFSKHRLGSNIALDQCIKGLVDMGYLVEVDKGTVMTRYNKQEKCYRILDI